MIERVLDAGVAKHRFTVEEFRKMGEAVRSATLAEVVAFGADEVLPGSE